MSPELKAALWKLAVDLSGPVIVTTVGGAIAWVRAFWEKFKRDRRRTREAHDLIRRIAYYLQLQDESSEELRNIRAKAMRNADEAWVEEGNTLRRRRRVDDGVFLPAPLPPPTQGDGEER